MATHVQSLLQARIYAILTGDGTLTALLATNPGVFDFVPDNQAPPYVTIGDDILKDWGAHDFDGFEGPMTIHSWSQAVGRKEVKAIMNRIYTLLHNVDLGISGHKTVSCRQALGEVVKDPDGRTHHGIQTFNLILGGYSA